MNYIFVNKTQLIPQVITFDKNELYLALQLLKKDGNNKNMYIVKTYKTLNLSIIFYKNNSFQRINNDVEINNFNCEINSIGIEFIQQFEKDKINLLDSDMVHLNEPIYNHNSVLIDVQSSKDIIDNKDMDKNEGVIVHESNNKGDDGDGGEDGDDGEEDGGEDGDGKEGDGGSGDSEGDEEDGDGEGEGGIIIDVSSIVGSSPAGNIIKKNLKEECEKVMELYTIQKDKVNKLSRDVLMIEKRENKLIQDIYDKKFDLLSNLYTDLKVYDQLQEQKQDIPVLFCKKYEYFKNAKEDDIKIYERIKSIDINKLLDECINEKTINKYNLNELFTISKKYNNDLKKLNVIFEHSWCELEDDLGD